MLIVFCPLYYEAEVFIDAFHLKKKSMIESVESFSNEEGTIELHLTGTGKINAAAVVSLVLSCNKDAFAVFYGAASSLKKESDDLYIAREIYDVDTGFTYYPDCLIKTKILETGFATGSIILSEESSLNLNDEFLIYDEESSAFYQAANRFIGPHQMLFLRFVSDYKEGNKIQREQIEQKSKSVFPKVKDVLDEIIKSNQSVEIKEDPCVSSFIEKTHASISMQRNIHQCVHYAVIANIDYVSILRMLLTKEVNTKEEGKKLIHAFIQQCM